MLTTITYKKTLALRQQQKVTQDLQNNYNSVISAIKLLKHVKISQQEQCGILWQKPGLTEK